MLILTELLLLSRFSLVWFLCDPIDCSPPDFPVPGILQARTLEWVAISFSSAWKWKVKVKSLSRARLLATPWTAAYQASPSMGFSRQESWSGCHCLLQLTELARSFTLWITWNEHVMLYSSIPLLMNFKLFHFLPLQIPLCRPLCVQQSSIFCWLIPGSLLTSCGTLDELPKQSELHSPHHRVVTRIRWVNIYQVLSYRSDHSKRSLMWA